MIDRLDSGRGNVSDYQLGTPEGWDAFEVVRWHGQEEISTPYQLDITLRRAADKGPVDLDELVDRGATFRVATAHRWRTIHGILAEAEEIDRTRAFLYYRVLLVPPIWRMRFRRRCRTFVYRTLKDIVSCVLENRAHPTATPVAGLLPHSGEVRTAAQPDRDTFSEPHGRFLWRMTDEQRITNPDLHPFVAQYNESDFDFVTRWLAHEGVSYYFQHGPDSVVMILTDAPGQDSRHETDRRATLRGGAVAGAHKDQELVRWLRDSRRMRSRAVTMREYDFRRSNQVFDAVASGEAPGADALGHFEFPAKDDRLADKLASFPAARRYQRFETESLLRHGMSTLRTLSPGHALSLTDGDGLRDDEDLLIVRSETFATQHSMEGSLLAHEPFGFNDAGQEPGGFENRFQVLPAKASFRPATPPPKERIWGVQVARVWGPDTVTIKGDDEAKVTATHVDIHCDEHGRVCVQFPWDTRNVMDGQPSSDWCRVAQSWAGSGFGAVHIPRVGHEVLVAFENGDPDRPVIVGSVYTNPDTPPPYDAKDAKNKTRTTLKTQSTTVSESKEGYNELRFTDYKDEEQVYLQAERDLDELVKHDHSTSVGGNQSNSVGGDQSNSVQGKRTHDVTGTESVHVHGDRTTTFDANETHTVGVNRTTNIASNETLTVGANRSSTIGDLEKLEVGGNRLVIVHGQDTAVVTSDDATQVGGSRTVDVKGVHKVRTDASYLSEAAGDHAFKSGNLYCLQKGEVVIKAGSASLTLKSGTIALDNGAGAMLMLSGSNIVLMASGQIQTISGGSTNLLASEINGSAGVIHLNG